MVLINVTRLIIIALTAIAGILLVSCSDSSQDEPSPITKDTSAQIVFLELGSEDCVPCQKMKPVMDSIRKMYGPKILVKFVDVLKYPKEAAPYKIVAMPTQIFLDSNNVEIYRHVGFFPLDSVITFLGDIGITPIGNK